MKCDSNNRHAGTPRNILIKTKHKNDIVFEKEKIFFFLLYQSLTG
nr:MAG TPA: hypothetical protein [Caudoviricetes sp.]